MRRLLDLLSPLPFPAWFMRIGGRLNVAWLRIARGRGPLTSNVLILTTRGRQTGRERSTPVLYFDRGAHRYIVASFAGVDHHPAWYLNLVADPRVSTEVGDELTRCVARGLGSDEAAEVWPHLDRAYHGFRRYRNRTSREIPIVELIPEPVGAASAAALTAG
jgi:deazaflavin-dependent oxidoreductase (nitroreductase family)